jgi:hypothetical protein
MVEQRSMSGGPGKSGGFVLRRSRIHRAGSNRMQGNSTTSWIYVDLLAPPICTSSRNIRSTIAEREGELGKGPWDRQRDKESSSRKLFRRLNLRPSSIILLALLAGCIQRILRSRQASLGSMFESQPCCISPSSDS